MIGSIIIFTLAYFFIATEKLDKTIVAVLGAAAMLAFNLVPYAEAVHAIDLNVIFLIVGMMVCVSVLAKSGFFEWLAMLLAKKAGGRPGNIIFYLTVLTACLSALLDNVTTVVLIAPVTILIAQILEVTPVPFLILEVISSNIGGTATLIGDPPNIVIGSQAELSFFDFIHHLTPVVVIIMVVFCIVNRFIFKNKFAISDSIKKRIEQSIPHLAITDKKLMIKALLVLLGIMLCFLFHHVLHVKPGIIALAGAAIMLLITGEEPEESLKDVEWSVIFFFIGLFIMISALEHNGVIEHLAKFILDISAGNLIMACLIILWGSAIFSSVLDNIPFVITMVPLIKEVIPHFISASSLGDPNLINAYIAQPLWWSLALGACLGGNGTLIGASANIVVSQIGAKNKAPIHFLQYMKYGVPYMTMSLVIASFYLLLRYLI